MSDLHDRLRELGYEEIKDAECVMCGKPINSEDHDKDCRWALANCEYKDTHNYCPHPEHACTCPPKKPLHERLEERGFKPVNSIWGSK